MLDTNIFISMIFFPSSQTRELAKRLTDAHQIIVCDYVIEELRLVVERKFPEMRNTKDSPILATVSITPTVLTHTNSPYYNEYAEAEIWKQISAGACEFAVPVIPLLSLTPTSA